MYINCLQGKLGKNKQTNKPPQIYFLRVTSPQEESQDSPSGGILEEGIAIIGGQSFMCVTAPEVLPREEDTELEYSDIDDPDPGCLSFCVYLFLLI